MGYTAEGKQSHCCARKGSIKHMLWLCDLQYRILLPLSSKMLKFIILNEIWRGQSKHGNSCGGLVICGDDYPSLKHLKESEQ